MRALAAFAAVALALASNVAHADCPWEGEVESAYATMTMVTINGKVFPVKGAAARAQFMSTLAECDANPMAQQSFTQWRSMRRATNITGGVGALCFWPALIATPITAVMAGTHKDSMIGALLSN